MEHRQEWQDNPRQRLPNRVVKELVEIVLWSSRIQRLDARTMGRVSQTGVSGATEDGDPSSLGIEDGVDGSARMTKQRP